MIQSFCSRLHSVLIWTSVKICCVQEKLKCLPTWSDVQEEAGNLSVKNRKTVCCYRKCLQAVVSDKGGHEVGTQAAWTLPIKCKKAPPRISVIPLHTSIFRVTELSLLSPGPVNTVKITADYYTFWKRPHITQIHKLLTSQHPSLRYMVQYIYIQYTDYTHKDPSLIHLLLCCDHKGKDEVKFHILSS